MPTTVTLYPFRVTGIDSWQGNATAEQAVADSSDVTWVALRRGVPVVFDFGPVTGAPGPTVVTSCTVNIRTVALDDITRDYFVGRLATSPTLLASNGGRHVKSATVTGSEASPIMAGTAMYFNQAATWTPLTIDTCSNVTVRVWADGAAADSIGIARCALEVVYDTAGTPTAPTVTVSAPTGTLATDTTPPTITWTSTTTQRAWQVRVFTAAQYGAGGFDPGVDDATWETGPHGGDQLGVTIATALDESTAHRAYVRSHDGYQWSAWAYSAWSYATVPTVATDTVSSAVAHDFDVTWTYTSGGTGARQAAAEVRVFDSTPSAPATDEAQWGSGVVWQSAPFLSVPEWIEDTGTNEVWVRVMDTDGVWSAWDSAALTLTPSATSTPGGATATWSSASGRVVIVLPVCTNAGTGQVQRSDDAGSTWNDLDDVATSASVTVTTYDYRAPLNASPQYRWRQLDATTDGAGAWATIATVSTTTTQSWVKHPTDASLNQAVRVLGGTQQADTVTTVALTPAGRDLPVFMSDGLRGADEITVDVHASTWAQTVALDRLFRDRAPLLVQRADGQQWWVAVRSQSMRCLDGRGVNWALQWQASEVAEP